MTPNPKKDMPFLKHLEELRRRIVHVFLYYVVLFTICVYASESIFNFLRRPMESHLPANSFFIATAALSGWLVYMKVAMISAGILVVPFCLFEVLSFITPGLSSSEKKSVIPVVVFMSLFFYSGIAFAFYFVLPMALTFFSSLYADTTIHFLPNIEDYLSFTLMTLFGFGFLFILPFVVLLLVKFRVIPWKSLNKARPYIYVGAFIVGAIFTPPDVASQLMMSIPFLILFEFGMGMSYFVREKSKS